MLFSKEYHKYINFLGITIFLVGLPLSKFLMSLSQFVLGINWLISGGLIDKIKVFWSRKELVLIAGIFVLHVLGLLWTSDFDYGIADVVKKMPILVFPIVFSSKDLHFSSDVFLKFLKLFVVSIVIATGLSMMKYFGLFWESPEDPRQLSIFYSHIRFGLLIDVGVFSSFYLYQKTEDKFSKIWLVITGWFVCFTFVLQSLTAILVLILLVLFAIFYWPSEKDYRRLKVLFGGAFVFIVLLFGYKINKIVRNQLVPKQDQLSALKDLTPYGNKFVHDLDKKVLENGYYVYINISFKELTQSWNRKSKVNFDGKDNKGQLIKATLLRFLTSKGWEKSGESIDRLTEEEILAIENGVANVDYMNMGSLELRVNETIWEIGTYFSGKNPGGNTLTQRFEFWRIAKAVIDKNLLFGVGTGDVKKAEMEMYETLGSALSVEYRKRAHNQYLTIWVALGIIGLFYFLVALIFPFFSLPQKSNPLFFILLITAIISFSNEDTLETLAGVTIFSGLFGFFLSEREITPDNKPVLPD